jgi:ABC-2 type transport system ATP-binding protein
VSAGVLPARLENISKAFGRTVALSGVDLAVEHGEIHALLGPNGAGKTTALNTLVGLRRPDAGRALLFGRDPRSRDARLRLGCTPQETGLPPTLTVRETLDLVRAHFPHPRAAAELLATFDLDEHAPRQVGGLSGGQRRRLSVALAFAGAPSLLVLDEPTTGLDVASRRILWSAIRAHADAGGAVLLSTHQLEEAEALASCVTVIADGRVRAEGSVDAIRALAGLARIRIASAEVPDVPGIIRRERSAGGATTLYVRDAGDVVRELVRCDSSLDALEVSPATLEEAFVALTETPA